MSQKASHDSINDAYVFTISNPKHHNALNDRIIDQLLDVMSSREISRSHRLIVLRGEGKTFCAGRELDELRRLQTESSDIVVKAYEKLRLLSELMEKCPIPVVAVVEGLAMGAGAMLANWCDIVIAEETATFAYPEVKLGISPQMAVALLAKQVPKKIVSDLVLTGRRITAAQAAGYGFVSRLVTADALEVELSKIVAEIRGSAPAAIRDTKAFVNNCGEISPHASASAAVQGVSLSVLSREASQGVEAFFSKTKMKWPMLA